MYRRVLMRRQITLLLHCIRLFYGAILLNVVAIALSHSPSVLANVITYSGIFGKLLLLCMSVSSTLLILDTAALLLWDAINSEQVKNYCDNHHCLGVKHIQALKNGLMILCAWANRRRHWFYLPPAIACLFVIPMSYWLGIYEANAIRWFYLCLFIGGIGFAMLEGLISNERSRHAQ